ncbi:hypothetical protein RMATCC62417_10129 [Rhizopus microsporus]|nr:hypothetical protein RMATCC62417_10129 [Rhizopus microsporus]
MIPTYKRKTSFNASSPPPPSKKSPFSPDTSPPPPPKTFGRPMTTAAAAAAAIKRSSMPPHRRQSSSSNVTPSRQGSVETEREDSLVSQVLNQQCSQTMAFVVAGFAKVYVGEIIEKARDVMEEWNDTGPIRPEHLREAHRRYLKESSFANLGRKF